MAAVEELESMRDAANGKSREEGFAAMEAEAKRVVDKAAEAKRRADEGVEAEAKGLARRPPWSSRGLS